MKIGIDLDGVVFDSEKEFRVYSELYDMLDLKQNSKINNKELKSSIIISTFSLTHTSSLFSVAQ